MHPDYDKKTFEHDVCILKVDDLEQGMDLANNSVADFACLPSGKIDYKILEVFEFWNAKFFQKDNRSKKVQNAGQLAGE